MKHGARLLMLVIAIEVLALLFQPAASLPDFPAVDLSLLEDRVSIDTLRNLRAASDRSNPADWKQLGEYYLTFGYYPQSEVCFRVAKQLNAEDDSLLLLHAMSLDRMGAKRQAIDGYRQAIDARARTAKDFRIRIAQCLLTLGEEEQALQELKRISDRPDAQLLHSRMLIRQNKTSEAAQILFELQARLPDYLEPFSMYSFAAQQAGDMAAARTAQGRSLRADKNMISSQLLREEEFRRRGEHSSLIYYEESLKLEDQGNVAGARDSCHRAIAALWEVDVVRTYALFELHYGNANIAINVLNEAIDRVGGSMELLDALGDAYAAAGRSQSALDSWLRAVDMQGSAAIYEKIADAYAQSANASAQQRMLGLADYERGKQAWLENKLVDARGHFQSSVSKSADSAHAWYYLAETQRLQDNASAASEAYQKCLELNPNHGRAWQALRWLEPEVQE